MIKIKNVTIKNFLSVGNATQAIDLGSDGLTLVLGSAPDANGAITRNGAGKSTIIQAVSYALYGKPLTKIKLPNLVNNINNKGMVVTLSFEKDNTKYRIERGQKPAFMRFFVNDAEVKDTAEEDQAQGDNRRTQDAIEHIIGLSHTLFKHVIALNTFTDPFLKMTVSEQRAVIEELLGVTQLSEKAEILKKIIGVTKDAIRDEEAQTRASTEANARIQKALEQTRAQSMAWNAAKSRTIAEIQSEIDALDSIDFDAELSALDALERYLAQSAQIEARLSAATSAFEQVDRLYKPQERRCASLVDDRTRAESGQALARLEKEIVRKREDKDRFSEQSATRRAEVAALDAEPVADSACKHCGQKITDPEHRAKALIEREKQRQRWVAEAVREDKRLGEMASEIAVLEAEVTTIIATQQQEIAAIVARIRECDEELIKIGVERDLHRSIRELALSELAGLGDRPQPMFKNRDEYYRTKQAHDVLVKDLAVEVARTDPYVEQIASLAGTLVEVSYEALNDLQDRLKHQDVLLRLLTNKDSFIRKKIIDQNLYYLNTRLNHYLDKLGLPHEVKFQPDLSVDITKLGRDFDFEQLSRGEMNRVIMATSWAFRDIWENLNEKISLMFLDEMIDNGTDNQGAEAALDILKTMSRAGRNIFLISHKDELVSRVPHTLLVEKIDDFSTFRMDNK